MKDQKRAYNFNPGPAVLPEDVIKKAANDIWSWEGRGIGIMEMSHRSDAFANIIERAEVTVRNLLNIGNDYAVIFPTGGGTNQFSTIPMSFLNEDPHNPKVGNYLITGSWSYKALQEAKKFGKTHVAASSEDKNFSYIPKDFELSENPAYLHFTSNNTIIGTQYKSEPEIPSNVPLICDASSDLLHKKIDVKKYGLLYAGAQKNLGTAGVTLIIIKKDLLELIPKVMPTMQDYRTYVEKKSLYNTPPIFPIYIMGEVLQWIEKNGGLSAMEKRNESKAKLLYDILDKNDFFIPIANKKHRSLMNVTFVLRRKDLEPTFIEQAMAAGLCGLKGHRSIGGIRASIYNAFPKTGIEKLVEFMDEFSKNNA